VAQNFAVSITKGEAIENDVSDLRPFENLSRVSPGFQSHTRNSRLNRDNDRVKAIPPPFCVRRIHLARVRYHDPEFAGPFQGLHQCW
jgi:hypothetical protein